MTLYCNGQPYCHHFIDTDKGVPFWRAMIVGNLWYTMDESGIADAVWEPYAI